MCIICLRIDLNECVNVFAILLMIAAAVVVHADFLVGQVEFLNAD